LFVVYYKRKGEIKREYRNWCRYNERLNDETGGSETPLTLIIRVKGELKRVVLYKSRKRELKTRLMNEGRCDERLKTSVEESTCLTYTGFHDKTN
jgi:hypothetical protein